MPHRSNAVILSSLRRSLPFSIGTVGCLSFESFAKVSSACWLQIGELGNLNIFHNMDKLLEFGRKAWFLVRILSGYEERRIRSYRLQLQRQLEQAQEKKAALRKIPEQAILAEVRRMVEDMQTLNQRLEETEAAIEEYFKPIDKEAQLIMNMQLEGEEKTMQAVMKAMQEQALLEKTAAEKLAEASASNATHQNQGTASIPAAATTPTADPNRLNS